MSTAAIILPITLETVEADYRPSTSRGDLKDIVKGSCKLIPVGSAYAARARRTLLKHTFAQDAVFEAEHHAQKASLKETEVDDGAGDEPESKALLSQDPKAWKAQDHYAVLGLTAWRYNATDDQIRRAYRKKVLRHHPDKKASKGNSNDDSFYKCIGKAYELLMNPEKRRQFDSVDAGVEDLTPDFNKKFSDNDAFFAAWQPAFALEARFSKRKPVPDFGNIESTKEAVSRFYDFWYNFDSWRSFEYLDKEGNEGSDASRDEKRYAEKKNKAERALRKTEDNTRLRLMIDAAFSQDPRMKLFKAQEKAAKEAKRKGKASATNSGTSTPVEDPVAKKAELEKLAKEAEEAAKLQKVQNASDKKARENAKKAIKKAQKAVTASVTDANYFLPASQAPSAAHIDTVLSEVDAIFALLEPASAATLKSEVDKDAKGALVKCASQLVADDKAQAGAFTFFKE